MFGQNHKLNDSSLYMMHDVVEGQLQNAEYLLEQCQPEDSIKIKQLQVQIANFKNELDSFEKDIEQQRTIMFQFSIEELYYMYGQYEHRFIGIEFHKHSDAAKIYGREIGGVIVYSRSEREELERIMSSDIIPRTNGIVKIDATSNYNLSKELHDQLINVGFISGDIYEISASNSQFHKSFKQPGIKEIPGTININVDLSGMDPYRMELMLFSERMKDKGILTENEWFKFCGYLLFYAKEPEKIEFIKNKIFDENGTKNKMVRFYELKVKLFHVKIDSAEIHEFFKLLKERTTERIEILRLEISKSTDKTLEVFAKEYPNIYETIETSATTFEEDTLEYLNTVTPIYWDFRSYLHIYLRHWEELNIEGHFTNKTKFQYTQKDIRRILEIAIQNLSTKINERLSMGKDFRVFGDKSLYFNGNFYCMRIEPNGRVDSFNPIESK